MKIIERSTLPKILCGLVLAATGLTACGGSDSASTTLATVPATTPAPTTAPPTTAAPSTTAPATTAPPVATPAPTAAPTPAPTPAPTDAPTNNGGDTAGRMSLEEIQAATDRFSESESILVMTWGDVDGDGDEDAIVNTYFCGASCGFSLDLVLDVGDGAMIASYAGPEPFAPWVVGAGAGQSSVTSATISGSTITLVGTGLCGDMPISETDEAGSCNFTTERTATYEYRDDEIRSVSIDPEP